MISDEELAVVANLSVSYAADRSEGANVYCISAAPNVYLAANSAMSTDKYYVVRAIEPKLNSCRIAGVSKENYISFTSMR